MSAAFETIEFDGCSDAVGLESYVDERLRDVPSRVTVQEVGVIANDIYRAAMIDMVEQLDFKELLLKVKVAIESRGGEVVSATEFGVV